MKVDGLNKALRRLEPEQGRIARRNARGGVLAELRRLRHVLNAEYPAIRKEAKPEPESVEHPALRDARRLTWRRWEWKYLNPGAAVWDRTTAQAFVDFYAASIGQPKKPILFDLADGSRFLGLHAPSKISMSAHAGFKTWDTRIKDYRSADWSKWRTLLHEVAHYRQHGHGAAFKAELWAVYQSWKQWRAQRHGLESAARRSDQVL